MEVFGINGLAIGLASAAAFVAGIALARLHGASKLERDIDDRDERLSEFRSAYEQRAMELDALKNDVRDAVRKTRELREELIQRATETARERALRHELEKQTGLN